MITITLRNDVKIDAFYPRGQKVIPIGTTAEVIDIIIAEKTREVSFICSFEEFGLNVISVDDIDEKF